MKRTNNWIKFVVVPLTHHVLADKYFWTISTEAFTQVSRVHSVMFSQIHLISLFWHCDHDKRIWVDMIKLVISSNDYYNTCAWPYSSFLIVLSLIYFDFAVLLLSACLLSGALWALQAGANCLVCIRIQLNWSWIWFRFHGFHSHHWKCFASIKVTVKIKEHHLSNYSLSKFSYAQHPNWGHLNRHFFVFRYESKYYMKNTLFSQDKNAIKKVTLCTSFNALKSLCCLAL